MSFRQHLQTYSVKKSIGFKKQKPSLEHGTSFSFTAISEYGTNPKMSTGDPSNL